MPTFPISTTNISSYSEKSKINVKSLQEKISDFEKFPYRDGEYKKRNWGHSIHTLCSYPSKLKPSIAHILIQEFTNKGSTVLDPFSGSGTIPFEASNLGRNSIAIDLNPFAYRLSSAKINVPPNDELQDTLKKLDKFITENKKSINISEIEPEIKEFFQEETLREIVCAKSFCLDNKLKIPENQINFIWSSIAHILHGNRPYSLSRRSHNIIPIPPKGDFVYKSLLKSLNEKIARTTKNELDQYYLSGKAINCSAFHMPIKSNSIDTIITSPPFLGTTEFLRHNKVRLWFSGWDLKTQKEKKAEFLESEKTLEVYKPLLKEFFRVLKPKSLLIMHVGVVKKIDMAQEIKKISLLEGFKCERIVYEDATDLESHGRTDRGSTHTHEFIFLTKN